jgi:hypothetical protein
LKSNARATAVLVDEFCAAASKVLHPNIGRVRLCGGASSGSFSTSSSYLSILNANLSSVSPSTADRKLVGFEEKLQSPVDYIHHIFLLQRITSKRPPLASRKCDKSQSSEIRTVCWHDNSLLTGKLSGNFRQPGVVNIGNDSILVAVIQTRLIRLIP